MVGKLPAIFFFHNWMNVLQLKRKLLNDKRKKLMLHSCLPEFLQLLSKAKPVPQQQKQLSGIF